MGKRFCVVHSEGITRLKKFVFSILSVYSKNIV